MVYEEVKLNGNCQNCGCRFEFDISNGYLTNNITAQRLNNEVPHYKDNCEAWCKLCNCSCEIIIKKWFLIIIFYWLKP